MYSDRSEYIIYAPYISEQHKWITLTALNLDIVGCKILNFSYEFFIISLYKYLFFKINYLIANSIQVHIL